MVTNDFNTEFEAGHLKQCIFLLNERNIQMEEHIRTLYKVIGNLPQMVSDIESWRKE